MVGIGVGEENQRVGWRGREVHGAWVYAAGGFSGGLQGVVASLVCLTGPPVLSASLVTKVVLCLHRFGALCAGMCLEIGLCG